MTVSHRTANSLRAFIRTFWLVCLVLACVALSSCADLPKTPTDTFESDGGEARLVVRFLDVGQGDAALLDLPDGTSMLVDGGDYRAGAVVAKRVRQEASGHLRHLVATHPHADHIGGLVDVLDTCETDEVWLPDVDPGTATSNELRDAITRSGAAVRACEAGMTLAQGEGFRVRCLWPPTDAKFEDLNDYSAILLVTCGPRSLLLTGDAHADVVRRACENAGVEHVDALKAAHHGSETGTDAELLDLLTPGTAIISYGLDNPYGHPDNVVLDMFADAGVEVCGTGANGEVSVILEPTGTQVRTERDGTVTPGDVPDALKETIEEASSAAAAIAAGAEAEGRGDADVVYVTPTGERYHRAGCSRLHDEVIPLVIDDAIEAGYTPCGSCNP